MISSNRNRKGTTYALAAYLIWGLFPVYWKQLDSIPALQLIGHRIVWSFALLGMIVLASGSARDLFAHLDRRVLSTYAIAAVLIAVNWFAYVWGVTHGLIVEASLGYFINPLFSVVLGLLFFGERLRPLQWIPIGIAAGGIVYLTVSLRAVPWLALLLALTFGLYGAVKKRAPLGSLFGLTVETAVLVIPAVAYLIVCDLSGSGAFLRGTTIADVLMAGAGPVTAFPLLLFAAAASRVPLTTIGLLQYVTPTMQFLIGWLIYRENVPLARLIGFGIVWVALAVYWLEGTQAARRRPPTETTRPK